MSDLLRVLGEWLSFLWPLKQVMTWERGALFVFGKYRSTLEPGTYFVFPWFMHIIECSVVNAMCVTPRLDVTLHDGKNLTLWATAWARVVDVDKAVNTVEDHTHTTMELIQAIIADRLAKIDSTKLEAENRAELLRNLTKWCDAETQEYGVEITKVRFTTFVLNARTYRLIQ